MEMTAAVFRGWQETGPIVLMPAAVFFVCLLLRVKPGRAFRAALNAGIGLVGVTLLLSMINTQLQGVMAGLSERMGLSLSIPDIGWAGTAPAAWASPIGAMAIPLAILINMGMLALGLTRTVNIDIWNIWHMAFTGAVAWAATGSLAAGIGGFLFHAVLTYKLGDCWGRVLSDYFGMAGMTVPHGTSAYMAPLALMVEAAADHLGPLKWIDLTADTLQDRLGVLAEPAPAGFFLGILLGLMAGLPPLEAAACGIRLGAFMLLVPRVVKCLMEGLVPIQEQVRAFALKRYKGEPVYIGMDPAILLGDPTVMTAGILMVPITFLLAVILPGNRILPMGDLATAGFFIAVAAGIHRGNLFRTLLSGSLIMTITIRIANRTSLWVTALLDRTGMLSPGQTAACLDQGGCPITWLYTGLLTGERSPELILVGALYLASLALALRAAHKRSQKELRHE